MPEKKRIASLCHLRITVTLGVILLHVCSTLLENQSLLPAGLTDAEAAFHRGVIRLLTWCVPCFLMISGSLLLRADKRVTLRDSAFKYARRVLLALLVFGFPFAVMMDVYDAHGFSPAMIPDALMKVVSNRSMAHLWYLYVILGIYLLLPAIKPLTERCSPARLGYVLLVLFLFNFVLPTVSALTGVEIAFSLPVTSCYLFYFILGHWLTRCAPGWMRKPPALLAGIAVCAGVIVLSGATGFADPDVLSGYDSPVTALLSACVFSLFLSVGGEAAVPVWRLDRLCFGVFLIHPVLIHLLYRVLGILPAGALYPLKTLAVTGLIAAASYALSWALTRIPPLRKYVL
ncbi:MAG: acyltransferase family protein [Clostridia bacterium]|nr:acyltransferase family protein [Clostridia bacterium]